MNAGRDADEIVEFLAQPENLDLALEIEKRMPTVRRKLQRKFWHTLERVVRDRLGSEPGWKVMLTPDADLFSGDGDLGIKPERAPGERYVYWALQPEVGEGKHSLFHGVSGSDDFAQEPAVVGLPQVGELRNALRTQLLTAPPRRKDDWYLAWEYLNSDLEKDSELIKLAGGNALEDEVAETLVGCFRNARDLLVRVNEALAGKRANGRRRARV